MSSHWHQLRNQLTWQAIVGASLLIGALFFNYFQLQPMEERFAAIESGANNTQEKLTAERATASNNATFDKFYAFFESRDSVTDELAKIYSISETHGIMLKQARYKVIKSPDDRLLQYQIVIQTTGEYGQIRNFALQVMNTIPSVSLDSIRFERQHASSELVESEVVLSLYRLKW